MDHGTHLNQQMAIYHYIDGVSTTHKAIHQYTGHISRIHMLLCSDQLDDICAT